MNNILTISLFGMIAGVWLMHCHLDVHITWGLAMAFVVDNGVGELESLEHAPADLPVC